MKKFIFVCVRSEKRQPHRRFTNYFVRLLSYARKRNAPQMWWDTEQVAHHFGVSRKSIPEFIRNGLAPPVKFSNKIHRFSVESVYEFDRTIDRKREGFKGAIQNNKCVIKLKLQFQLKGANRSSLKLTKEMVTSL